MSLSDDKKIMILQKIETIAKAGVAMLTNSDFSTKSKEEWMVFALDTMHDYLVELDPESLPSRLAELTE